MMECSMARVRKRLWINPKGEQMIAWVCDWLDTAGKRQRRQFQRKRDAETFRITIENQMLTGTYRSRSKTLLLIELTKLYLAHCQDRMERGERMTRHNLAVYRGHINNHILHIYN